MAHRFPEFSTKRLFFRRLHPKDAEDVYRLFSDPYTMMFDGGAIMGNTFEADDFIRQYRLYQPFPSAIRWAITDLDTDAFYGTGGFHKIDWSANKAEIGGELLRKHWQKGIGKEALRGLLNAGFHQLRLNRITAMMIKDNIAAQALLKYAPLTKEGTLQEWERWGERYVDLDIFRILKREWEEIHQ
ncbi:GNAT family N-acetyltransferase [Tuberibacillus sp. Marseille-P3662]|uniref:GNAT family N-acetyltransferase n=1 Tax=Tuberibacillus sp. Marseille-P3662 TaxID=1965358 RepID=UPI000A1CD7DB|nr:GNAT family protein [Tuberibacillus sp. Marseille-P3662]